MQIHLFGPSRARAIAAILRNCLTSEHAPLDCPVRKCRRDGCCSGPLAAVSDGQVRLATGPDDSGSDTIPIPVCWFALSEGQMANIRIAAVSNISMLDCQPAATVAETTRAICARRFKRLGPVAMQSAAVDPMAADGAAGSDAG